MSSRERRAQTAAQTAPTAMRRQRDTTPRMPTVHMLDISNAEDFLKDTSQHLGHVVAAMLRGKKGEPLEPDEANLGWCSPAPPEWEADFLCLAMQVYQQDEGRQQLARQKNPASISETETLTEGFPRFYFIVDSGRILELLKMLEEVPFHHFAKFHVFSPVPDELVAKPLGSVDDQVWQWRDRQLGQRYPEFVVSCFRSHHKSTQIVKDKNPVLAKRGGVLLLLRSPRTDAVQILVLNSRYGGYAFPGGRVDWGKDQSPAETGLREFDEEANPGSYAGWSFKEAVYGNYAEAALAIGSRATAFVIALASANFQRLLREGGGNLLLPKKFVTQLTNHQNYGNKEAICNHWKDPTSVFLEHDMYTLYTFDLTQKGLITDIDGNVLEGLSATMLTVSDLLCQCWASDEVDERLHAMLHKLVDFQDAGVAVAPSVTDIDVPTETRNAVVRDTEAGAGLASSAAAWLEAGGMEVRSDSAAFDYEDELERASLEVCHGCFPLMEYQ